MEQLRNLQKSGIFIVMKYPEKGKVKSRLANSIGAEAAAHLYQSFIQDTISIGESVEFPFHIAVHPPDSLEPFSQLLGSKYKFFEQKGADLGERLHNGFLTMFDSGFRNVIALASDCPDLPPQFLEEALSSLQTHDVVLGPAPDGGYYLIGFTYEMFTPEVFFDMHWGSESVLQESLTRISRQTEKVHILSEWQDIDTKDDLRRFYETHKLQSTDSLYTMKCLNSNPHLLEILLS